MKAVFLACAFLCTSNTAIAQSECKVETKHQVLDQVAGQPSSDVKLDKVISADTHFDNGEPRVEPDNKPNRNISETSEQTAIRKQKHKQSSSTKSMPTTKIDYNSGYRDALRKFMEGSTYYSPSGDFFPATREYRVPDPK